MGAEEPPHTLKRTTRLKEELPGSSTLLASAFHQNKSAGLLLRWRQTLPRRARADGAIIVSGRTPVPWHDQCGSAVDVRPEKGGVGVLAYHFRS